MEFFGTLNFTSTNEDGQIELTALAHAKRILCVTGTGTRALDLLAGDADEIVALDANPLQNALLALKMAAIGRLDRSDYLAFIGLAPCAMRREVYAALRHGLPDYARDYWDGQAKVIERGIWLAGQWERLLHWNARFLQLTRRSALDRLMAAPSIAAQSALWERHFSTRGFSGMAESLLRNLVWRIAMREPAAQHMPDARLVANRIDEDFRRAAASFLFRESDIATLALRGRHTPDGPLPLHMRAENYDRVRSRLGHVTLHRAALADLRPDETGRFDAFSLSDFGSYCGPSDYEQAWRGLVAVAEPEARFCERVFMNPMPPPACVTIDDCLSEDLSQRDKSIIYRVRTGTISK